MALPGHLEKPWRRIPLLRELAAGEKTQTQLAAEYGCQQSAVSTFASRHAEEITALRDKLDSEWAGLWVAQKAARLAVYQNDIEQMDEVGVTDEKLAALKAKLLRQVAEEVGDLRADLNVTGRVLHHVIEGVTLSDLE